MATPSPRPRNRLLAALPDEDFQRISYHLAPQPVSNGYVFHRRDQPIRAVFFPTQSLTWLINPTEDGTNAQVAMVGPEGLVGVEAVFGSRLAMSDAVVNVVGKDTGHAMSIDAFYREFERRGAFYNLTRQYGGVLVELLTRWAGCNAWHSAEGRCCRWLLEAAIRMGRPDVYVTHELLSDLLGLRRSTVTLILGRLQESGAISASRGVVRVDDQAALEERSCGCHRLVARLFERPPSPEPQPVGESQHEASH
jgi:CRP-like cAMP-binding protein